MNYNRTKQNYPKYLQTAPAWDMHNPWPFFRRIERDISEIAECVDFNDDNGKAYGEDMARLIITIGSEIDTNLRIMTGGSETSNMKGWKSWLATWNPNIVKFKVISIYHRYPGVIPIPHINDKVGYEWWDAYNAVKHNRQKNRKLANVVNLTNISCALFAVNSYYTYRSEYVFEDRKNCTLFSEMFDFSITYSLAKRDEPKIDHELRDSYYGDFVYDGDNKPWVSEEYYNLALPPFK